MNLLVVALVPQPPGYGPAPVRAQKFLNGQIETNRF